MLRSIHPIGICFFSVPLILISLECCFHFALAQSSTLPATLPNYDFDGKDEFTTEPWPDMLSPEEQAELKRKAVYYQQDTKSMISNLLSDAGDIDMSSEDEEPEVSTHATSTISKLQVSMVVKLTCSSSRVKTQINKATTAIKSAMSLLQTATDQGASAAKAKKVLKWMRKWLNDVAAFLKARKFNKASNKLVAVTNNMGYAQSLATKPAANYIQAAVAQVTTIKTYTDSLSHCSPQTTLVPEFLDTAPTVQVPNPTPYSGMQGLVNSGNAQLDGPDFNLTINKKADKVFAKSINTFESGVFTVSYKCPQSFAGIISGFYLSSEDEYGKGDIILFEVLGNHPDRVRVGIFVNGSKVFVPTIDLGVDCSKKFHTYTIILEANTIRWLFDGELLRHMDRNDPNTRFKWITSTQMNVYASIRVHNGWGVGTYDPTKAPFVASFADLKITSPITAQSMPAIPVWPRASYPLTKFGIDYARDSVTRLSTKEIVLPYDPSQSWDGGRVVSPKRFDFGEFSAQIRCPTGNASGLVTSFYLSSMEGGSRFRMQDEIDFEFLGKNHSRVQLTYFVTGKAVNAVVVDLGYDCSSAFHLYTLRWMSSKIMWLVDNKVVHRVLNDGVNPYPTKPSYLYASVWNANGSWSGPYFGKDAPYFARYRNITMTSPLS